MRIETLKDRIENAKAKIEKKTNTITKKEALIVKKTDKLQKMGFSLDSEMIDNSDARWLTYDIGHLEEDIKRLADEIEETKTSLEKYEKQLAGELEKENIILKEIPEGMRRMQSELVETWDAWDIQYREKIKADRRSMEYRDWCDKYNASDRYDFMYKTDEQIHNSNVQDAKMLILNLYYRVKDITGEITDWSGIRATIGTQGFTVLNGYVIGKEGRAEVESIYAGGYNIQRLHVRVLVHEIQ